MCYGIIYKIENKINGKIYIGQTTRTFDERYHGSIKNTHNKYLKRSIEKHDIENFEIDKCLCECDSEEELNEAEKFYIDFFDSANPEHGYNMTLGGEGGIPNEETRKKMSEAQKGENSYWYGKRHSQETKKKMSKALKGEKNPMYGKHLSEETKQKLSKANSGKNSYWYGKHLSEETKQKLSKANSGKNNGMRGKHHSEETKQKMSKAKKGKRYEALSGKNNPSARAVIQLDKNGNFIKKYDFIKQAEKELNIARQRISACCKGKIKSAGGYIWMYEEDFISSTTGDTLVPFLNKN